MFKVKGIDHINLNVKSLEKAKDFYEKFFGFEVKEDYEYKKNDGSPVRFMLIGVSEKLMLCLYEDKGESSDISNSPLSHLGINVENFDESLKLAQDNGLLDQRWGVLEYKKSRSFYIEDPNGLELEISEAFAGGH